MAKSTDRKARRRTAEKAGNAPGFQSASGGQPTPPTPAVTGETANERAAALGSPGSEQPTQRRHEAVPTVPSRTIGATPRQERRTPSHDEIARRAYGYFQARGCAHGNDWADWLRAERELRAGTTGTA